MKTIFALVLSGVLWILVPQVWAQGDVGSTACREVQLEAQAAVTSGGPYTNHGQLVATAARVVSAAEEAEEITEECASCIVTQFAQGIAIDAQETCGPTCTFGGTGGCCSDMRCVATDVCRLDRFGVCFTCRCGEFCGFFECP
jgi:hypothetical protein